MIISQQLDVDRILLFPRADKVRLLGELVHCLAAHGVFDDERAVLESVLRREEQMSTGLGGGLAVPHARMPGIAAIAAALAVVREGMDFGALDGSPVQMVLLFISPADDAQTHSAFLSAVATTFMGEGAIARLTVAAEDSPAAVLKALRRLEEGRA